MGKIAEMENLTNLQPDLLNSKLSDVKDLMNEFSLTQSGLAEKIGMKNSTFRLKFNDKYPQYTFKPSEIIKILKVVDDLGKKIVDKELV